MKAQTLNQQMSYPMSSKKTLEVNPSNKLILSLCNKIKEKDSETMVKNMVWLLYETTLLSSGFSLEKPAQFATRIHKLLQLGLLTDDEVEEFEETDQMEEVMEEGVEAADMEEID